MRTNILFDKHTLDIVKAAMPHVHPRAQSGMNVLLKANDLMSTIENGGQEEGVSAMNIGSWTPDPEELLLSIKEVATPGEGEMLDTILNFIKARKIYSAYQNYSDTVMEAQGLGGNGNFRRNPFASMLGPFGGMGAHRNQSNNQNQNQNQNQSQNQNRYANNNNAGNTMNAAGTRQNNGQMPNFLNFLMSQMSPEQKQTFDMLNMMMNNMPSGGSNNVRSQSVKDDGEDQLKAQSLNEEEDNTANEGSES